MPCDMAASTFPLMHRGIAAGVTVWARRGVIYEQHATDDAAILFKVGVFAAETKRSGVVARRRSGSIPP